MNAIVTVRKMPQQKPGKSKQNYGTPWNFIQAVEARFGPLTIDLAATKENAKAPRFITPEQDSLKADWAAAIGGGLAWLNPPFGFIKPWAKKCAEYGEQGYKIFFLTPYGVQDWYVKWVRPYARTLDIYGRMLFEGEEKNYPKDLRLSCFGFGKIGSEIWDWRKPWKK